MNWLTRSLFVGVFIISGNMSQALAAETDTTEDVIVPLKKGIIAPFDGQLFDVHTAIRWGVRLSSFQERADLLRSKDRGICDVKLAYKDDLLKIQLGKDDALLDDLKTRMLRSDSARVKAEYQEDHPAWYKTVWFGIGVGTLSAVTLIIVGNQVF